MKLAKTVIFVMVLCLVATLTLAQAPNAQQQPAAQQQGQRGGGRGRGQQELTPEQQVARQIAQQRLQRPMERLDTVWLEEMTVTEVRDAISSGSTTALILTGGVEANGPHLAQGKHNYVLRVMGESIARRLGNALVAPIVTLEPNNNNVTGAVQVGRAGPMISQETYLALLTDIGDSLRGMGFTKVLYMGDSGSNRNGMMNAANALNAKYKGEPTQFYHIPEYYDYASIQTYIQETLKIPEQINIGGSNGWADSIHEEYGIDALMALADPATIRFEQRVKAGRAVINGVPLAPLSRLLDHGEQFRELRTQLTVAGIYKALAAAPPVYGQQGQQ